MATQYVFKCKTCYARYEALSPDAAGETLLLCDACGSFNIVRDYASEGVGFQTLQLKRDRDSGGRKAARDLFLPTAKEMAGPNDPTGDKGLRAWNESHVPKSGNTKPLRPPVDRQVF